MGNCCGKIELNKNEDYINYVFSTLEINKQRADIMYNNLLKNFDNINSKNSSILNNNAKDEFINLIIAGNKSKLIDIDFYEEIHRYFNKFFLKDSRNTLKLLGTFIIFNGYFESIKETKNLLIAHILHFYGKEATDLKKFIEDIININTSFILESFDTRLNNFEYYNTIVWNDLNKEKLKNNLFNNYYIYKNNAHNIEPFDIIPKTIKITKKKTLKNKKKYNESFNSVGSETSTSGKTFEEDKELILKKFVIEMFDSLKGSEIRNTIINFQ